MRNKNFFFFTLITGEITTTTPTTTLSTTPSTASTTPSGTPTTSGTPSTRLTSTTPVSTTQQPPEYCIVNGTQYEVRKISNICSDFIHTRRDMNYGIIFTAFSKFLILACKEMKQNSATIMSTNRIHLTCFYRKLCL